MLPRRVTVDERRNFQTAAGKARRGKEARGLERADTVHFHSVEILGRKWQIECAIGVMIMSSFPDAIQRGTRRGGGGEEEHRFSIGHPRRDTTRRNRNSSPKSGRIQWDSFIITNSTRHIGDIPAHRLKRETRSGTTVGRCAASLGGRS